MSTSVRARRIRPGRGPAVGVCGLGYVGIATAVSFAHYGYLVVGYDIDERRRRTLAAGECPVNEKGLASPLRRSVRDGRFRVTEGFDDLLRDSELVFLCVPTPEGPGGEVDSSFLESAATSLGRALRSVSGWRGFVVKSTVPPGTTVGRVRPLLEAESGRRAPEDFDVAANPEFLAEGSLWHDAIHPSRIVLGVDSGRMRQALDRLYRPYQAPRLFLSPTAAELVKYASNALLATKISFANEISRLCESLGIDVYEVMKGVGMDPRLGPHFLQAGPGFGGSCFPKDLKALLAEGRRIGVDLPLCAATLTVNETQAVRLVDRLSTALGGLEGRIVGLLGLAFKAGTSDVRESRAWPIVATLLERGAFVHVHDPRATKEFLREAERRLSPEQQSRVQVAETAAKAITGCDAVILQAAWPEYRRLPAPIWRRMRGDIVLDARRSVRPSVLLSAGKEYWPLGGPPSRSSGEGPGSSKRSLRGLDG